MGKNLSLFSAVLFLSFHFLAASAAAVSDDLPVVLDYFGNPVRTDAEYLIKWDTIGFVGGLVLEPIDGSCARYAAFSFDEVEPGIPVRFHPYFSENELKVGSGWRFKIEFTSAPPCAEAGEWSSLEGPYVVAGGSGNSTYFEVWADERGKYELHPCGQCAPCDILCLGALRVDGNRFLRTTGEDGKVLNVYFMPASSAAALPVAEAGGERSYAA